MMSRSKLRLIFMGTSEFAVPSLEALLASNYEVVAVVTTPDKPQGRGRKVAPTPVKVVASKHHLPILQPVDLQEPTFLTALSSYQAHLQVVVAFRILPQVVWDMPALGTINLHASLLPNYRGAAPINWAIMNGERETGVTTFFLTQGVDTGPILFQEKEPIHAQDNVATLYHRLKQKGALLVLKTLQAIEKGNYAVMPQSAVPSGRLKKAPKIYPETCQIDWTQEAATVLNFIRGLSPHPAAWTILHGKTYKILAAEKALLKLPPLSMGEAYSDGKNYVCIGTSSDPIAVQVIQLAGRKPMSVQAFLSGSKI